MSSEAPRADACAAPTDPAREPARRGALRTLSILCFLAMVAALLGLVKREAWLGQGWIARGVQGLALALMIWARLSFGMRSFHAAADPQQGALVTQGAYRWLRHPIYAAVCWFLWAAALSRPEWQNLGCALLGTLGAFGRMLSEERLLRAKYPDYAAYAARTRRVLPFVL